MIQYNSRLRTNNDAAVYVQQTDFQNMGKGGQTKLNQIPNASNFFFTNPFSLTDASAGDYL